MSYLNRLLVTVAPRHAETNRLRVDAPDRPGLLADVAASLARERLAVLAGEAHTAFDARGALRARGAFWVVDDRTGDVTGFQKPRATVLVDVDGDAFLRAFFDTVVGRA